jgi:CubicO group peptidase (beta-lactamase class C family)
MHLNLLSRFAAAFAVLAFFALMTGAQDGAKSVPSPAKPTDPPGKEATAAPGAATKPGNVSDPADLEAFFDGVLNVQLESKRIAGAVVAVVVGDKLVFSKGYGYADIAERKKVDPDRTLFRIASISKLFIWTAVMQQTEEGKLDLDADVNTYLKDIKIPPAFDQPITLKNLLTHTPGFDDSSLPSRSFVPSWPSSQ